MGLHAIDAVGDWIMSRRESTMPHVSQSQAEGCPRPRFRLPVLLWMVIASVLLSGIAVGLTLWIPRLQYQRSIARIHQMGGVVYSQPGRTTDVSRWLSGRNRQVLAIDLSGAELSDGDLAEISDFDDVRRLLISGPGLTDSSLQQLKHLKNLESLVFVNCPRISDRALQALEAQIPGLRTSRRGAALLGIVGETHSYGCRIQSVRPGSAAAKSGLNRRDVITHFGGRRVRGFETLTDLIAKQNPGDRVAIVAYRRGRRLDLSAVLGSWKGSAGKN